MIRGLRLATLLACFIAVTAVGPHRRLPAPGVGCGGAAADPSSTATFFSRIGEFRAVKSSFHFLASDTEPVFLTWTVHIVVFGIFYNITGCMAFHNTHDLFTFCLTDILQIGDHGFLAPLLDSLTGRHDGLRLDRTEAYPYPSFQAEPTQ